MLFYEFFLALFRFLSLFAIILDMVHVIGVNWRIKMALARTRAKNRKRASEHIWTCMLQSRNLLST